MKNDAPVVVTGHTGVVGSYLTPHLTAKHIPLVLVNSRGIFACDPDDEPRLLSDDPFDRHTLLEASEGARACVHLGAAHSGAVQDGVAGALLKNAILTDFFASAAKDAGIESFVYSSSGAVYYQFTDPSHEVVDEDAVIDADPEMLKEVSDVLEKMCASGDWKETYTHANEAFSSDALIHTISPRAGYAFGKYAGELAASTRLQGRNCTVLRLANAFGPTDQEDRIIPKFVRNAREGSEVTVFDWSRNFIWIDDLIYIIERAVERKEPKHLTVNAFTPGNTLTLWELSQTINSLLPPPGGRFSLNAEVHEPHFEFATKHPGMLPPQPLSLMDGLKRLIRRS